MNDNRPNVLLVTCDQLGRNHTPIGGDTACEMPTLRYFAQRGISFTNCYSTCPVCIPARRSIMTGMSPRSHGDRIYNDRLPMPEAKTLAQSFRDAGYQAYAVGKLHVFPQRNRIGFDDVILAEEGRYDFGVTDDYQIWLGENGYPGQEFAHGMGNNVYYARPWQLPEKMHQTHWITENMCRMIQRADPTRPALFYLSYTCPHPPLVPPKDYLDFFERQELPPVIEDSWGKNCRHNAVADLRAGADQYTQKERDLARRAYYAQCMYMDHQMRLVIGTLRERNLLNNTILLFCADHGDMLFDHDMVAKRTFYESAANVPMVLYGKPLEQRYADLIGTKDNRICCLEDVLPTLTSLCGLETPKTSEGISLLGHRTREWLYGEVGEGRTATRMIRRGDLKLIYYPYGNMVQLFDVIRDPGESENLAEHPEYQKDLDEMMRLLSENLYGSDAAFFKDGKIIGFTEETLPPEKTIDYGLGNQRGLHWPQPGAYHNGGKNG